MIDTATDALVAQIQITPLSCAYSGVAVTPSGRNIYVSDNQLNQVWVIERRWEFATTEYKVRR